MILRSEFLYVVSRSVYGSVLFDLEGACISDFRGSSPVGKLDWDIDSRTLSDGLSNSVCLFGDDPVILQQM